MGLASQPSARLRFVCRFRLSVSEVPFACNAQWTALEADEQRSEVAVWATASHYCSSAPRSRVICVVYRMKYIV